MAVDESAGGWGASLLDLALVAEQHGRYLGLGAAPGGAGGRPPPGRWRRRELPLPGRRTARVGPRRRPPGHARPPPADAAAVLSLVPAGAIADDVVFFDGGSLRHIALDSTETATATATGTASDRR